MADAKYLANRLKYHTASRIATQTGEALAQALNVDGHIITTNKVWAAPQTAFINNVDKANTDSVDATNDLVSAFKIGGVETAFHAGGSVWTNPSYPAVRLYENVPMTKVKGSDGGGKFQAFEILAGEDGVSEGTKRIVDWIAPTAVADQVTGLPVAGYSGIPQYNGQALKVANPGKWAESLGSYEFAYMSGLLTFEPGFTPQDVDSANGVNKIKLTAFKYIGAYLSDTLTAMSQNTANSMMAIKPFKFSASSMQTVSSMEGEADVNGNSLRKAIPGIVLNVFNDQTGIAYGDILYASNGTSLFYIEGGKAEGSGIEDGTTFTAYAFVLATGSPITILQEQQLS
jgi:hypothetical protein